MIEIYKASQKKEAIEKEPKTGQTIIVEALAFIAIVFLGAFLGVIITILFALFITFIAGNGFEGFSLILNNNIMAFASFGAILFALIMISGEKK